MYIRIVCLIAVLITNMHMSLTVLAANSEKETKVRRVEINIPAITVRVNQTRELYEIVTPTDADDPSVIWSSSNEDVVYVEQDGTITGVSPGTATIRATASNGKVGKCEVKVPSGVLSSVVPDIDSQDLPGAQIGGGELLNAAAVKAAVEKQVGQTPKGQAAIVEFLDKSAVSADALRAAAFTAEYENGQTLLRFVTTKNGDEVLFGEQKAATQGRLTIDPHKAKELSGNIATGVYTSQEKTAEAADKVKSRFAGGVAVIKCGQQGSYGIPVSITAKPDLAGMDTGALLFYTYNESESTIKQLQNTAYYLDANGFIHLTTEMGGAIIIADTLLSTR